MIVILINLVSLFSDVYLLLFLFWNAFRFVSFFVFYCSKVPLKLICDWKELFFNGNSIYEKASIKTLPSEPSPEQLLELNKMDLLDEKDYDEYKVDETDRP